MSRRSICVSVYALAFLQLLVAGTGQAESRAARRYEPVALRLSVSEPGMTASVETADRSLGPKGRVVLQCQTVCDTEVLRGTYKLTLRRDGETADVDSDVMRLSKPLQITAESANNDLRWVGGILFITGAAAVAGGIIALIPMLASAMCHGGADACNKYVTLSRIGFIAAGGGGILVLVGLLMYLNNRSSFTAERLKVQERDLTLQLVPSLSGVSGVLKGRF